MLRDIATVGGHRGGVASVCGRGAEVLKQQRLKVEWSDVEKSCSFETCEA